MIRFEEQDSDPYTKIKIWHDGAEKHESIVSFSLDQFEKWLKGKDYPQSIQEAQALLHEYSSIKTRKANVSSQTIASEIKGKKEESYEARFTRLIKQGYSISKIHAELFPEEYDFMFDSYVEANLRSQGGNPMREGYQEIVNARRVAGRIGLLGESVEGSMKWCQAQFLKQK